MPYKKNEHGLTEKQEAFCQYYMQYFDAKRAATEAGYSADNAGSLGYQNLQHPAISNRIKDLADKAQVRSQVTVDKVLNLMWNIANVDIAEAYNEDGTLKTLHEIPEHVRKAINQVDSYADFTEGVEVGKATRVKFASREKMLDLLGKHLGMYIERIETKNLNVNVDVTDSEKLKEIKHKLTRKQDPLKDVTPLELKASDDNGE